LPVAWASGLLLYTIKLDCIFSKLLIRVIADCQPQSEQSQCWAMSVLPVKNSLRLQSLVFTSVRYSAWMSHCMWNIEVDFVCELSLASKPAVLHQVVLPVLSTWTEPMQPHSLVLGWRGLTLTLVVLCSLTSMYWHHILLHLLCDRLVLCTKLEKLLDEILLGVMQTLLNLCTLYEQFCWWRCRSGNWCCRTDLSEDESQHRYLLASLACVPPSI